MKTAFRLVFASDCFERAWKRMKFGIAIAARIPMIATTIISSIRVKPFLDIFFNIVLLGGLRDGWTLSKRWTNPPRTVGSSGWPIKFSANDPGRHPGGANFRHRG